MSNPNTEFRNKNKRRLFAVKEKPKANGIIRSSNGSIEVDLSTGNILKVDSTSTGFRSWASHISHFDLGEYREFYGDYECKDTSFDILDLGFWEVGGRYVPASKGFRNEIARDHGEVGF